MVEGSMTQGAGQGPDVWHGGTAAHGEGTGTGAPVGPPGTGSPVAPPSGPGQGVPAQGMPAQGMPARSVPVQGAPVPSGPVPGAVAPRTAVPDTSVPGGPPPRDPRPVGAPAPAGPRPVSDPRRAAAPHPAGGPPPGAPALSGPAPGDPAPGGPAPEEPAPVRAEMPEEYTPTARDLPVVGAATRVASVPEPTMVDVPVAAPRGNDGEGPLYVVGDVHGYLDELRAALRQFGIIDSEDRWVAGNARLWFLGDFTDRGPDGIGVIELVMQLSAEAAAAGGYCKALMGNHELLLLGAKRFGDTPVNSGAGTASFQAAWLLNGGQRTDMERLAGHHLQWMSRLDAIALADGHLLVHSDATCYMDYGNTIDEVNDAITTALQRDDAEETWDLFRKFTKRFAFRDEGAGPMAVRELLDTFGGKRIVHGHSPIPYLLGEVGSEDGEGEASAPQITGPHVYADGLAVAMDGGVTMAGKLLIAQLPLVQ
ncbi:MULTISPECIES: metallophosphoesterase [unclassified Streptomyces]|uniref:metallophosphoesterase n=1 Tax=unclassified Streptomyces TaxID=2593676 RepID=UPI002DD8195F|nr:MULTISPECIES: metallophosphoesterase [unclassified Streptomyces]